MEIQQVEGPDRGKFFIENNGNRLASLVYFKENGHFIIEHTEVDKTLRGRNIGRELVRKTVEYARTKGMKVMPVCPFAKVLFAKKPDWSDVLAS